MSVSSEEKFKEIMTQVQSEVKSLVRQRASAKSQITKIVNKLEDATLSEVFVNSQIEKVQQKLLTVEDYNQKIVDVYYKYDIDSIQEDAVNEIVNDNTEYIFQIEKLLSELHVVQVASTPKKVKDIDQNTSGLLNEISKALKLNVAKVHEVKLPYFSGSQGDVVEFSDFLQQFQDLIGSKDDQYSDAAKLTYLKSYLRGAALDLIKHLSNEDSNYEQALKFLKKEFLDVNTVVDRHIKKIINLQAPAHGDFDQMRKFFNEARSSIYELKNLGFSALESNTLGCKMISYILGEKLPANFKTKLSFVVQSDHPTTSQFLENYSDVIRSLQKNASYYKKGTTSYAAKSAPNHNYETKASKSFKPTTKVYPTYSTLQNFKSTYDQKASSNKSGNMVYADQPPRKCKLCSGIHSMLRCTTYSTPRNRVTRLRQLKLCENCSGEHFKQDCPAAKGGLSYKCKFCNSNQHISAVCNHNQTPEVNHNQMGIITNKADSASNILIPSVSIMMYCPTEQQSELVRCMIDPGSQSSYISASLRDKLKLPNDSPKKTYNIKTFVGSTEKSYEIAQCSTQFTPNNKVQASYLVDPNFNVNYTVPGSTAVIRELRKEHSLADSYFYHNLNNDDHLDQFNCLIGADLLSNLFPLESVPIGNGRAFKVTDGLVLFGDAKDYIPKLNLFQPVDNYEMKLTSVSAKEEKIVNLMINPRESYFNPISYSKSESDVDLNVENLFKIESLGIKDNDLCKPVEEIVNQFDKNIELKEGHYYVELPFSEEVNKLPSTWKIAKTAMKRVYDDLKVKDLVKQYGDVFKQQLEAGIIEELNISEEEYDKYYFIPHHPVIRMESQVTTKIRPVFNCSFKPTKQSLSLNNSCFKGIDLLTNLVQLLFQFRQNMYVLLADVEKAFLQIYLKKEEDRNKFCFFWHDENGIKIYRYNTIIFGLNVSPFILNRVIQKHLEKYSEDITVRALKEGFYVDNFVFSTSNEEELLCVYQDSIKIMAEGGFNLRSFVTNHNVLKKLMRDDNSIAQHEEPVEKLLGYHYNPSTDEISLHPVKFGETDKFTKRTILSNVNKIFDPLSLYLPVTIRGRLLMKEIWSNNIGWDEPIGEEAVKSWKKLQENLEEIMDITYPRMTNTNQNQTSKLHFFCDGSKSCYGFTCYSVNDELSQLVFAKGKVTPKSKSIPQVELLALFMTYKCFPLIIESHQHVKDIHIWVDAQIVLEWILTGGKQKNQFTKNRIMDIRDMEKEMKEKYNLNIHYHYVESKDNPSDLLTRGLSAKEFRKEKEFWMTGPHWITCKDKWPTHDLKCLSSESKDKLQVNYANQTNVDSGISSSAGEVEPILDITQFSNINTIYRITSYVMKFINKLRKKKSDDTMNEAKVYWYKVMQAEDFNKEILYLRGNKNSPIPNYVNDLNLFINKSGLLCCRGRISKSEYYCNNIQLPILLSKSHYLTKLIVQDTHKKCKHLGVGTTLMNIRENGFWLPSGRQVIKSIIKDCIICKKLNVRAFTYPRLTNLPPERISLITPFLHTGIDYTGHLYVTNEQGQSSKMYIILYTCLALRSVHLDLVPDMSLKTFLQSFKRFCNLYTTPDSIYTDNAKQFIASKPYLTDVFISDDLKEMLEEHSIKHKTIPVYASWVGGVYERQIKTVKQCLYKAIGRAKLNYFELTTVLSDVQNAVNSRPLTYVQSDINEIKALTPNMILKLNSSPTLRLLNNSDDKDSLWIPDIAPLHQDVSETFNKLQKIHQQYQNMWYQQYLLGLRETSKDVFQSDWENRIKVGDIVLVNTKDKPRVYWLMARVIKLHYGEDGKVRSATIHLANNQTAHYSIKHLYPLEIQTTHIGTHQPANHSNTEQEASVDGNHLEKPQDEPRRSIRKAAKNQRKFLAQKIKEGLL